MILGDRLLILIDKHKTKKGGKTDEAI